MDTQKEEWDPALLGKPGNRAVTYYYTSLEQEVANQKEAYLKYCTDKGYAIIGEYTDDSNTRPHLTEVLTIAEKEHTFDILIVYNLDSLGRDIRLIASLTNHVLVESVTENFQDKKEYTGKVFLEYVKTLRKIAKFPSDALDFIAAYVDYAASLKAEMFKSGYKPVCQGSFWEMLPLNEHPRSL